MDFDPLEGPKQTKNWSWSLRKKWLCFDIKKIMQFFDLGSILASLGGPSGGSFPARLMPLTSSAGGAVALPRALQRLEAFFAPIVAKICSFFFTFPIDLLSIFLVHPLFSFALVPH